MKRLGFAYDWSREVTTCLPDYYRWNQWFFLKLYEKGLAYRKRAKSTGVRSAPPCLANEQVVGGCCWRHEDTLVEQRELEQWFLRITNYADELLRDLDKLDGWPEKVETMQRNWIGRSEGTLVDFKLDGPAGFRRFQDHRLHHAHGHYLRRDLHAACARAPDRRATLPRTMTCLRAEVDQLIAEQRKAKEVGRHWRDRETRSQHRPLCDQSIQRRENSHLGRELHFDGLRHRRHYERPRAR